MPKGVPQAGTFRMTERRKYFLRMNLITADEPTSLGYARERDQRKGDLTGNPSGGPEVFTIEAGKDTPRESDEVIEARLDERFEILEALVDSSIDGACPALIVSGPAGVGKSHLITDKLLASDLGEDTWSMAKGYVRPTGLYRLLWQNRHPGMTLVFDDADTIFFDDTSLNLLKAACDSSKRRIISYLSEAIIYDDKEAVNIPKQFEFYGTIMFITNLDFDALIAKGHKLTPHLQALVSRSHYVDLAMKTRWDCLVRVKQVAKQGLFEELNLTPDQILEVIGFMEKHLFELREVSLRMALKIASTRKTSPAKWEAVCRVTALKQK